jgi:small redox-active disulfide protein 2
MPINIKVLGPGCDNCHLVEEHAREALAQLGLEAEIEHVTDRAEYPKYGLLFTPGLVIDGKLVAGGRIPTVADISAWLASAAVANQR